MLTSKVPRRLLPADVLLHPVAIAAVAVLVLNDHVLKSAWPGLVTGKLSDAAAMVLCPILLAAAIEFVGWVRHRTVTPVSPRVAVSLGLTVAAAFAAMKLVSQVGDAYGAVLGGARGLLGSSDSPVVITPDSTDAMMTIFVGVAICCLVRRARTA